jgi:hypothetical protein
MNNITFKFVKKFNNRKKGYKKGLFVASSESEISTVGKKYFPLLINSAVDKYSDESYSLKIPELILRK